MSFTALTEIPRPPEQQCQRVRMIAQPFAEIEAQETDNAAAIWQARQLAAIIDYPQPCTTAGPFDITVHSVDSLGVVWSLLADADGVLLVRDRDEVLWGIRHYNPSGASAGLFASCITDRPPLAVHELMRKAGPLQVVPDDLRTWPRGYLPNPAAALAARLQSLLLLRGIRASVVAHVGDGEPEITLWSEAELHPETEEWRDAVRAVFEDLPGYTVEVDSDGDISVLRTPAPAGPKSLAAADRILADPAARERVAALIDQLGGELR